MQRSSSAPPRQPAGPANGSSALGRGLLALIALAFCAAPVPGDVGGCGQRAQELDAGAFFESKLALDCERCSECQLRAKACRSACSEPAAQAFPEHCVPLVHDGEVCLRALAAASCEDYALFLDDVAPAQPTECNFCPVAR